MENQSDINIYVMVLKYVIFEFFLSPKQFACPVREPINADIKSSQSYASFLHVHT